MMDKNGVTDPRNEAELILDILAGMAARWAAEQVARKLSVMPIDELMRKIEAENRSRKKRQRMEWRRMERVRRNKKA